MKAFQKFSQSCEIKKSSLVNFVGGDGTNSSTCKDTLEGPLCPDTLVTTTTDEMVNGKVQKCTTMSLNSTC